MPARVIHVGIGVFGKRWCSEFLKSNVADGTVEVVALVDVDPASLEHGRRSLGLPASCCYTDAARAIAEVPADFVTVVVTPAHHEAVIDLALARGLDVLCEKPIADTLEASARIARKVAAAGRKMAVTMSHRFDQDKTTLRQVVRSGLLGPINSVALRFQGDMRQYLAWSSKFRHEMADPLLIEGAIHHLDIIADLAGAPCASLHADTWKPAWAEYAGDTDGIVTMRFANGVRGVYEGSVTSAAGLNTFYKEYIRVDGERGTAILDHRSLEVFARQPFWRQQARPGEGQKVPLVVQPKWINHWLIEQFVRWREGGPAMETRVENNVQASAMVFAAIESSRSGHPVDVQALLAAAGGA